MQSAHDDDEALEPHSGVHAHANEIDDENISPAPPEPEELRRQAIAKQHAYPPVPPIRTEYTVPKSKSLVSIAAVPSHEKFHCVGVPNEGPSEQNDLRHLVDVLRRDDVLQFEHGPRRNEK